MFEIWIPLTIAAAFFQTIRSGLQKQLHGQLSVVAAAYVRFIYALPLIAILVFALHYGWRMSLPIPNLRFFIYCGLGGICQILFTALLLKLFSYRSFAVGITFSKLEVIMVAIFGAILLGDNLPGLAIGAIILSTLGVVALSAAQANLTITKLLRGLIQPSTVIGLAAAATLGASSVFFRGATLALNANAAINTNALIMTAAYTLLISLIMQTVAMGIYIKIREPGELSRVILQWRRGGLVGAAGAVASLCWFAAFTVQNAGYVRALGQIELLFALIATAIIFNEQIRRSELLGVALISAGIIGLLMAA